MRRGRAIEKNAKRSFPDGIACLGAAKLVRPRSQRQPRVDLSGKAREAGREGASLWRVEEGGDVSTSEGAEEAFMLGSLLLKGWAVETAGKADKWGVGTGRERSEDKVQDKV